MERNHILNPVQHMPKIGGKRAQRVRAGVDTGGTFTDFIYHAGGGLRIFKIPSTPADPSRAITTGLQRIAVETGVSVDQIEVVHGTTVGTNALIERRGARTALVTTAGFEDVLAIGRQARPSLYDLNAVRPEPLVPSHLRFGVAERVAADGRVIEALDERKLGGLVARLRMAGVDSIAISLLFSFVYPEHERRIADALGEIGVPISVSHRILPEYREYERTSTVTLNAFLQPLMGLYLGRLESEAPRLRVMQSSGGSISARVAATEPVRTVLSGPAGGAAGALHIAGAAGVHNIITFDMGGTSTDVALCEKGRVTLTSEGSIAGLPVAVPMMDIHTVGAGGGSIARIDAGGSLRVGPESAGADPGPACYGRSLLPTVTDAHVVLRHFGGGGLLGGEFQLDAKRSDEAIAKLAKEIAAASGKRTGTSEAALGVLSVVNVNMERALRAISVERGHDPRDYALVPFGGAGGLHAVDLARAMRIPRVIVPPRPGALSAQGALSSDVIKDLSRTVMIEVTGAGRSGLATLFQAMEREAAAALRTEGFPKARQRYERSLAARYRGQSFELAIPWTRDSEVPRSFHAAHLARYGYAQEDSPVEIVSARLRALGVVEKPRMPRSRQSRGGRRRIAAPHDETSVFFGAKPTRVAVYHREVLAPGESLRTPCIVTEYSSTTLVPAGARGEVDSFSNLVITP